MAGFFDDLDDNFWSSLYDDYDPLNPEKDEVRGLWATEEDEWFLDKPTKYQRLAEGIHTGLAGNEVGDRNFEDYFWEPDFWRLDNKSLDGLGSTLNTQWEEVKQAKEGLEYVRDDLYQEYLPDFLLPKNHQERVDKSLEEFLEQKEAADIAKQVDYETVWRSLEDDPLKMTGATYAQGFAQELPFLVGSMGSSKIASVLGSKIKDKAIKSSLEE